MGYGRGERRSEKRSYIEPYETGTFLEFTLEGKEYRFNLLDTSPGGMGMLVKNSEADVLKRLSVGDQIKMKYGRNSVIVPMKFEIKHITTIKWGNFEGHYQVGLSLLHK